MSAAKRRNNDSETLKYFAGNAERLVRNEVAKHFNTPLKILKKLLSDRNKIVRLAAIKSQNKVS